MVGALENTTLKNKDKRRRRRRECSAGALRARCMYWTEQRSADGYNVRLQRTKKVGGAIGIICGAGREKEARSFVWRKRATFELA